MSFFENSGRKPTALKHNYNYSYNLFAKLITNNKLDEEEEGEGGCTVWKMKQNQNKNNENKISSDADH